MQWGLNPGLGNRFCRKSWMEKKRAIIKMQFGMLLFSIGGNDPFNLIVFMNGGTSKEKKNVGMDGDGQPAAPVTKVVPTPVRSMVVEPPKETAVSTMEPTQTGSQVELNQPEPVQEPNQVVVKEQQVSEAIPVEETPEPVKEGGAKSRKA